MITAGSPKGRYIALASDSQREFQPLLAEVRGVSITQSGM